MPTNIESRLDRSRLIESLTILSNAIPLGSTQGQRAYDYLMDFRHHTVGYEDSLLLQEYLETAERLLKLTDI